MEKGKITQEERNNITFECPYCKQENIYLSYGYIQSKIKCFKCKMYFKTRDK